MAIKDAKSEQQIDGIFIIKSLKALQEFDSGNKLRFEARVGDSTGEITVKYWGSTDKKRTQLLYDSLKKNDVVHIIGKINEFQNQLSLSTNEQLVKLSTGQYDPSLFLAKTTKDTEVMYRELEKYIDYIQEPYRSIALAFFDDSTFVRAFKIAPASTYRHHNWIGGLLEHTLTVTKMAYAYTKLTPDLNASLLLTGALLHDIGKIQEYAVMSTIERSTEGILSGHIMLAVEQLHQRVKPSLERLKIEHCILSHHGHKEFGSPVTPTFSEAMALHQIDMLDSQTTSMLAIKKQADGDFVYHKDYGNVFTK